MLNYNPEVAFKKSIRQMIALGKEFLVDKIVSHSRLNRLADGTERDEDNRRLIELHRIGEITATANIIKLFTGREISFQWQNGADGEFPGGFALYEIMPDCPCDRIPPGCSTTVYSRFTDRQEPDRRVDWRKGREDGKIVMLYEYIHDKDKNPRYVENILSDELRAPTLTATAIWVTGIRKEAMFNLESERDVWITELKGLCEEKGWPQPTIVYGGY